MKKAFYISFLVLMSAALFGCKNQPSASDSVNGKISLSIGNNAGRYIESPVSGMMNISNWKVTFKNIFTEQEINEDLSETEYTFILPAGRYNISVSGSYMVESELTGKVEVFYEGVKENVLILSFEEQPYGVETEIPVKKVAGEGTSTLNIHGYLEGLNEALENSGVTDYSDFVNVYLIDLDNSINLQASPDPITFTSDEIIIERGNSFEISVTKENFPVGFYEVFVETKDGTPFILSDRYLEVSEERSNVFDFGAYLMKMERTYYASFRVAEGNGLRESCPIDIYDLLSKLSLDYKWSEVKINIVDDNTLEYDEVLLKERAMQAVTMNGQIESGRSIVIYSPANKKTLLSIPVKDGSNATMS